MADQHRSGVQVGDDRREVLHDVVDALASHRIRIGPREVDRFLISGPARGQDLVASLLEHGLPWLPGAWMQPEAVNENDRMRFVGHLCRPFLDTWPGFAGAKGIAPNVRGSP